MCSYIEQAIWKYICFSSHISVLKKTCEASVNIILYRRAFLMTLAEIKQLIQKQRTFFHSDATLDVEYRIHALQKLKACILK